MNICVGLYKGRGLLHNAVVRRWTKSIYSHAELILPDRTAITIFPFCPNGIHRAPFDFEGGCDEEWDFICVPVTDEQLEIIEDFYRKTAGQKYDWTGMIISQLMPYHVKHESKWYCSAWIAYALRLAQIVPNLNEESVLSPEVLSRLVNTRERVSLPEAAELCHPNAFLQGAEIVSNV